MTADTADVELGQALLALARHAIATRLLAAGQTPLAEHPAGQSGVKGNFLQAAEPPEIERLKLPALDQPAATFVTLTRKGELRGCIGSLEAYRPLRTDVEENARAAAFRDPRFPPVVAAEWPAIGVEVSLLTPPEDLPFADEEDLKAKLRPNIDGVILAYRQRRATFLPQVWAQLPTPELFLAHLKQKAGLAADFWSPEIEIRRYQVDKWTAT